jgi:hypothetical protein
MLEYCLKFNTSDPDDMRDKTARTTAVERIKQGVGDSMSRPYLSEIDFQSRVLEIGPFTKPNVPKERYKQVYYADIRSTEDVKSLL